MVGVGLGFIEGFIEKNVFESFLYFFCEGFLFEVVLIFRLEGKVFSWLVFGSCGGYNGWGWGFLGWFKKKYIGMVSIDSSVFEIILDSFLILSWRLF